MMLTALDWLILAIILGSMAVALFRGLAAELLSLCSWLLAFWVARSFAPEVAGFMPLAGQGLQLIAAFVVLLLLTWLATALFRVTLTALIDAVGLGGVNRFLGVVFGLARGLLLVTVLVMLGGMSTMPQQSFWHDALLVQPFETVAMAARPWLPDTLAQAVHFF
ncbi:CvpA family protein [Vogesella indigofera]|jgi:membrane protein required for colicin V production|uniref:CvpA family protein n=1 Tax=Vogesella indigofera TaxID=45465 RepID=A0ABT5I4Y3_VOGIN|nr:CvpA family protein [Vogesella indigofera]MDC7691093.1 CvpA family protein [Vogesella indigofera]